MKIILNLLVAASLLLSGCGSVGPAATTATPVPPSSTPPSSPTPLPSPVPAALSGSGGGVLAFTSERDGNMEIYLMNADGSDQRRMTRNPLNDGWAFWSPDGTQLVYHTVEGRSSSAINILNISTGAIEPLPISLTGMVWEPAWSHDGKWIAFSHQSTSTNSDIYITSLDGKTLTKLTDAPGYDGGPLWSPDDRQIAFYSDRDGNFELYVMNADGTGQHRLTDNPAEDLATGWSPDGQRLAFFTNRDGNYELYSINADGSDLVRLTDSPYGEKEPAWSPDGTLIAFSSNRDGNFEIYVAPAPAAGMFIEESAVQRLTDAPGLDMLPAWMPVK